MNVNIHFDDEILKIGGVREILSIINSGKIILQKIKTLNLLKKTKSFITLIYMN
jgi:hypothetical protein